MKIPLKSHENPIETQSRFAFGISWGFGAWLYISEIMPLRVRGKAVGLCTAARGPGGPREERTGGWVYPAW